MKKIIFLLVIFLAPCVLSNAQGRSKRHHMTRKEFKAKQQRYLTRRAKLTEKEAEAFFPIYFELQKEKRKINDSAWKMMRRSERKSTKSEITDSDYEKVVDSVLEARIESSKLEKQYFKKFKKILPGKKLFLIQRSEFHFRRQILIDARNIRASKRNKAVNKRK